jgi:hypothetical protein
VDRANQRQELRHPVFGRRKRSRAIPRGGHAALHRLDERGWVESEWKISDAGRRAKFYRLTTKGRAQLRTEHATWGRFVRAVSQVLEAESQPA